MYGDYTDDSGRRKSFNPLEYIPNAWKPAGSSKMQGAPIDQIPAGQQIPKVQSLKDKMGEIMPMLEGVRQKGLDKGRERGQELFSGGSMGRISANRSEAMGSLIDRLKSKSTGWSDPEAAARKEQALRGITGQLATSLRAGRANTAAGGMRGAIAGAQQKEALRQAQRERSVAEQGLMVSGEEAARAGLQNYYTGLSGQEGVESAKEQWNIGQMNKEKMAQLAMELGYGQLAGSDMAAAAQIVGGEKQADLARDMANQNQPGFFGWLTNAFNSFR